jgi:integrase
MAQGDVTSMSTSKATPARRTRVERNIYVRPDGKTFEVGYRDSSGKQRWKVIAGGITAARRERDSLIGSKAKGEIVQPNPRLKFGEAADRWLSEQVTELRPATRAIYRNAVEIHLRPRWGNRRMDHLTVDDAARLIRELRAEGKAEWTIAGIVKVASRIFSFARRRCSWHGENVIGLLENGERPKTGQTGKRRIFSGDELASTLAAALQPYRLLFMLASVTGARLSELLGLTWADVDLRDTSEATVRFEYQADRQGKRQPLKTEESRRTVEIPRQLAAMLLEHKAASPHSTVGAFVFCSRSARALGQRNVLRELRRAMTKATDAKGRPMFPILSERDERGQLVKVPKGAVPNFHSFRHTAASEAIAAGDGAEEVSWQLGHKNSIVTRTVYVQEIKSAERTAKRRAKMEARYGSLMEALVEAPDRNGTHQTATSAPAEVLPLRG